MDYLSREVVRDYLCWSLEALADCQLDAGQRGRAALKGFDEQTGALVADTRKHKWAWPLQKMGIDRKYEERFEFLATGILAYVRETLEGIVWTGGDSTDTQSNAKSLAQQQQPPQEQPENSESVRRLRAKKKRGDICGAKLTRLRESCGFSMEELADKSGVDKTRIVDYENGRSGANPSTMKKLADALGRVPADLLS